MNELEVNNLKIKIKHKNILESININLKKGEWLSIVGENGAGKTSLVRAIVGIKESQKKIYGEILFKGKRITSNIVKNHFSYISQISKVVPGITLEEYVALSFYACSSPFSKLKDKDKENIKKSIEKVGLKGMGKSLLTNLSGGELKKASLALGLVYDRDVVIFDEPTNHLDLKSQIDIIKIMRNIKKEGKTIILITHDINMASRVSDNIVLLKRGRIRGYGKPGDLIKEEIIKKVFNIKAVIKKIEGKPQIVNHK